MASIRKQGNNWQARISRKGVPVEVRTFSNKADAERWARSVEPEMDLGGYLSRSLAERVTLTEIIVCYIVGVSPRKRGGHEEIIRLEAMKRHSMAQLFMASLTPMVVGEYRDHRLKTCGTDAVIRDLGMLSSVINQQSTHSALRIGTTPKRVTVRFQT